ncbi:MAG TPA: Uma2 family endonuclease [Geminicoccaceae bacterium]|nr:Uma2 family endonuclease [Geminicoccaceae bacterium]
MAQVKEKLWTLEEFLAFDDGTDTSYQLFEGRIAAMNPPLRGHAGLVGRLVRIVGTQLQPPCEVYAEAGIIPVNRRHTWYKADLIVSCTPGNYKEQFIAEPVLVVEVLSPTTRATDFGRQLPDYQQIPSMRDILLVSSMERVVRHWRRESDGWSEHAHRRSATFRLSGLPVAIAMDELYDRILPG